MSFSWVPARGTSEFIWSGDVKGSQEDIETFIREMIQQGALPARCHLVIDDIDFQAPYPTPEKHFKFVTVRWHTVVRPGPTEWTVTIGGSTLTYPMDKAS